MKIRYPYPDQLEAQNGVVRAMLIFLVGGLVTGLGGWVIVSDADLTTLDCDRLPSSQINCQWREQSLHNTQTQKIINLTQIDIETNHRDTPLSYRLYLITPQQRIAFNHQYTEQEGEIQTLAQELNAFIADTTQTQVQVKLAHRWQGTIIGSLISAMGLFGLYQTLWSPVICICRIDRQRGVIAVEYRSLIRHCLTNQYLLKDVLSMATYQSKWDGKKQMGLLMNSGNFIVLTLPGEADDNVTQTIVNFLDEP